MKNLMVSMLFLTAVVSQATGQAQDYNQLASDVKTSVDQAIHKANQENAFGHLNFYRIGNQVPQVESRVRIDVRLKATTCRKVPGANKHRHRPLSECPFKQLEVRCLVCHETKATPWVDCVRRKDEKARHHLWTTHCFTGLQGQHTLFSTDGSTPSEGCLGCF